jgi:hypothetical protein
MHSEPRQFTALTRPLNPAMHSLSASGLQAGDQGYTGSGCLGQLTSATGPVPASLGSGRPRPRLPTSSPGAAINLVSCWNAMWQPWATRRGRCRGQPACRAVAAVAGRPGRRRRGRQRGPDRPAPATALAPFLRPGQPGRRADRRRRLPPRLDRRAGRRAGVAGRPLAGGRRAAAGGVGGSCWGPAASTSTTASSSTSCWVCTRCAPARPTTFPTTWRSSAWPPPCCWPACSCSAWVVHPTGRRQAAKIGTTDAGERTRRGRGTQFISLVCGPARGSDARWTVASMGSFPFLRGPQSPGPVTAAPQSSPRGSRLPAARSLALQGPRSIRMRRQGFGVPACALFYPGRTRPKLAHALAVSGPPPRWSSAGPCCSARPSGPRRRRLARPGCGATRGAPGGERPAPTQSPPIPTSRNASISGTEPR